MFGRGLKFALPLPLLLCGCASLSPVYVPSPIRIYDAARYEADREECLTAGKNYVSTFDLAGTLSNTVTGATSNTSLIPINPLVPAYGAAGGLAKSLADGLDIMSQTHFNVARHCLTDELAIDHAAIIARPEN